MNTNYTLPEPEDYDDAAYSDKLIHAYTQTHFDLRNLIFEIDWMIQNKAITEKKLTKLISKFKPDETNIQR